MEKRSKKQRGFVRLYKTLIPGRWSQHPRWAWAAAAPPQGPTSSQPELRQPFCLKCCPAPHVTTASSFQEKDGENRESDKPGRGGRSTKKAMRDVCQLPSEWGLWWCPEDSSDFSLAVMLGVCWPVQNQTKPRFRNGCSKGQLKPKLGGSIFLNSVYW